MKTPEEIKADAATCLTRPPNSECNRFALYPECKGDCRYVIKELYDLVLHYESRLAQAERERDAAIKDIPRECGYCKHCRYAGGIPFCFKKDCKNISGINTGFEWRGVCPEIPKEDEHA